MALKTIQSKISQAVTLGSASLLLPVFMLASFVTAGVVSTGVDAATTRTNSECANGQIDVNKGIQGGTACADPGTTPENLVGQGGIFQLVANILLFLVGAVAVIMLIIGGLRYVTSNGDQNAVTGAKNTIMYAIIGIVVAFLAYAAVNFVTSQLGANVAGS